MCNTVGWNQERLTILSQDKNSLITDIYYWFLDSLVQSELGGAPYYFEFFISCYTSSFLLF